MRIVASSHHRPSDEVCTICGIAISEHARCHLCQILAGEGHIEMLLIDGLCRRCAAFARYRFAEMHAAYERWRRKRLSLASRGGSASTQLPGARPIALARKPGKEKSVMAVDSRRAEK